MWWRFLSHKQQWCQKWHWWVRGLRRHASWPHKLTLTKAQTASGPTLTYPAKETVNNHNWLNLFSSWCIKMLLYLLFGVENCFPYWYKYFSHFCGSLMVLCPDLLTGSRPYIPTGTYRPAARLTSQLQGHNLQDPRGSQQLTCLFLPATRQAWLLDMHPSSVLIECTVECVEDWWCK